jgi:hypothetical protein
MKRKIYTVGSIQFFIINRIPLSAGTFNRPVYLEGMKRRLQAWDPNKISLSNSASCSLQWNGNDILRQI